MHTHMHTQGFEISFVITFCSAALGSDRGRSANVLPMPFPPSETPDAAAPRERMDAPPLSCVVDVKSERVDRKSAIVPKQISGLLMVLSRTRDR